MAGVPQFGVSQTEESHDGITPSRGSRSISIPHRSHGFEFCASIVGSLFPISSRRVPQRKARGRGRNQAPLSKFPPILAPESGEVIPILNCCCGRQPLHNNKHGSSCSRSSIRCSLRVQSWDPPRTGSRRRSRPPPAASSSSSGSSPRRPRRPLHRGRRSTGVTSTATSTTSRRHPSCASRMSWPGRAWPSPALIPSSDASTSPPPSTR